MASKRTCALVTGASLGLGRALARECAARGMDLLLVALPGSGLPQLAASIEAERGVRVDYLEGDLTQSETLERLIATIRVKGLAISLLANNAGIGAIGHFLDTSPESHEATIQVNTLALVRLTRLMLTEFDPERKASILNVASLGAFFPMPNFQVYSATKSFVLHFSLALRAELGGRVGVSVLCPNAIRSSDQVDEYVDRLNLFARCACLGPERIARIALDGVAADRAIIIPGRLNRVLAAVGRFLPRALVMMTISHYWGNYGKEAAAESAARAAAADLPRSGAARAGAARVPETVKG